MKKIKSNNRYYLAGILPFPLVMFWIAEKTFTIWWVRLMLLSVAVGVIVLLVHKFRYLPYPLQSYGELKEVCLELPKNWGIKFYTSEEMDRYPFLNRYIEIFSSLTDRKEIKVIISPDFLKKQNKKFAEISVTREILKYCGRVQIKTTLGLVIPILMWITFWEAFFLCGWKDTFDRYSGITNFFGPIVTAGIIIITLFIWNRSVSRMDHKLDAELKKYYSREEIAEYIKRWDILMLPEEKELIKPEKREIEMHYIRERIDRL